jgi:hypothetical protein
MRGRTNDGVCAVAKVQFDPAGSSVRCIRDTLRLCSRFLGWFAGGSKWCREDGCIDLGWITIPAIFDDGPIEYTADIIDL